MKRNCFFYCTFAVLILLFCASCSTSSAGLHITKDKNAENYWDCDDMLRHLVVKRNMDNPETPIADENSIYSFFEREIYPSAAENLRSRRGYIKMTLLSADVKKGDKQNEGTAELSFLIEIQDRSKITIWKNTYNGTKTFTDENISGGEQQFNAARKKGILALEAEMLTVFWKDFVALYPVLDNKLPKINNDDTFDKGVY